MRKTLLFSFCCHLGIFSLFNFTFGAKLPKVNFVSISSLGAVLHPPDFTRFYLINNGKEKVVRHPLETLPLKKVNIQEDIAGSVYIKPQLTLAFNNVKPMFFPKPSLVPRVLRQSSSVVMLYPRLPQQFLLYFKDRQSVHVELMFSLVSRGHTKAIVMNRKISSGNLEADLFSKRYLGHYLFVQQSAFPQETWQTVKIDLSAREGSAERVFDDKY